jgi:putative nucleotide binding protein
MVKDDFAIILDFFPHGKPGDRRAEAVAQAIGEKLFTLLEIAIKEGKEVKPGDRVYIGEGKWDVVKYIRGRIKYPELTNFAKSELENVINNLVTNNEARFVNFFNKAMPLTTRSHMLELLPGIGKKHLWQILYQRKSEPFKSFQDLQERVEMLPDPKKMIVKRIINELEEKDRHRLFVGGLF